jgi:hypothetical protein
MRWMRMTLIALGVLACLVAVAYLTWPANHPLRPSTKNPASSGPERASSEAGTAKCLGSGGSLLPRELLDHRHVAAMAMVYQKHFDTAVPALRDIAAADPGYPGINLDLSDALLQGQHAVEAKSAISSQIALSDCLIELPDHVLQDYCATEMAQSDKESCRSQLTQMQRAAHFQAALIDMQLATNIRPATSAEVAKNPSYADSSGSPPKIKETSERLTKVAEIVPPKAAMTAAPTRKPVAEPVSAPPRPAAIVSPPQPATHTASIVPVPAPVAVSAAAPPAPTPSPAAVVASVPTAPPTDKPVAPKETTEPTSGVLRVSEASQHIGETRTVCGPVADKHTAPTANGNPTFIELERPYPNQIFTVLVWGSDKQEVGDLPANGNVCVTGKISTYAGLPEIVLHKAKDWSVANRPSTP